MTLRVKMYPGPETFRSDASESGIRRVVENYAKYLPLFGVQVVPVISDTYDLVAAHAGSSPYCDVCHNHGIFWSSVYAVE